MKKKNIIFTTMLLCAVTIAANAQKGWLLKGNTGTNPDSNFIGTKDVKPLIFKTNKVERMRINSFGSLYLKDPGQDNFYLLYGEKSSKGIGILIQNTSTTNNSPAIHGSSSGTGAAIIGQSSQAGSTGVYGYNSDGYGLKGQSSNSYGLVASSTNYYGMLAMGSTYAG